MHKRTKHMTPDELADIRERLGMTKSQLADHLDIDPRTVRRWELGEVEIPKPVAMLLRLMSITKT
jgi:DNA-binding transcriptional regulator YiaG